ncbi:hypothetical protein [Streptomyces sp. NPDC001978]|uniref:hypothetical protein n=1 Tax=Streptomyces sp. NPDC001978 TaxID=3364627 RepID=UPI0036BD3A08
MRGGLSPARDGGIVLGSVGVVRALAGHRSTRPYWTVTVGFTLVSWGFNVSNAPRTAGGWAVATVAPLAQMVALEMGMQELRALLLPQPEAAPQPTPAPAPAAAPTPTPAPAAAPAPQPVAAPAPEPVAAPAPAADSGSQQTEQQQGDGERQSRQQEKPADEGGPQRQQRPPLQADTSRPWAVLYEACSTEEQRIALTREALPARPKLTAPQWAVDIGKGETRARDLLRAARKPAADAGPQAQLELLSA